MLFMQPGSRQALEWLPCLYRAYSVEDVLAVVAAARTSLGLNRTLLCERAGCLFELSAVGQVPAEEGFQRSRILSVYGERPGLADGAIVGLWKVDPQPPVGGGRGLKPL